LVVSVLRVPPVGIAETNQISTIVDSYRSERDYWWFMPEGRSRKPAEYWLPKIREPSAMIRWMALKRLLELDKPPKGTKRVLESMLIDQDPVVAQAVSGVLVRVE
jgi:hypothetical protein